MTTYLTREHFKSIRLALVLIVFGVISNIPFCYQPFHIDDRLSIYMARQILNNFINPYDFNMVFVNGQLHNFASFYANPPLSGYTLAPLVYIFGESEKYLHLSFTLYTVLSGLFMYFLAKQFGLDEIEAVISVVLLIMSPGVFVMGHTIMPDTQLLFLFIASMYFFVKAEGNTANYFTAGILASLAALTRYTGVILILLFACYFLLSHRKISTRLFIAFILPVLSLGAWHLWATTIYGKNYWDNIRMIEGKIQLWKTIIHFLVNFTQLGGAGIFPLAYLSILPVLPKIFRTKVLLAIALSIAIFSTFLINYLDHSTWQTTQFLLMTLPLIIFMSLPIRNINVYVSKEYETAFLCFWILVIIVSNSFFRHAAVKYNILAFPPLILLFIRLTRESYNNHYIFLTITTIATVVIGVMVGIGDFKLANCYKNFAQLTTATYASEKQSVYFAGDWGWEYYMRRAGFSPILSAEPQQLQRNDTIIIPTLAWPQPLPLAVKDKVYVQNNIAVNDKFPIRTLNGWAKAFFYANFLPNGIGFLPYSFSSAPLEVFTTLKVK